MSIDVNSKEFKMWSWIIPIIIAVPLVLWIVLGAFSDNSSGTNYIKEEDFRVVDYSVESCSLINDSITMEVRIQNRSEDLGDYKYTLKFYADNRLVKTKVDTYGNMESMKIYKHYNDFKLGSYNCASEFRIEIESK